MGVITRGIKNAFRNCLRTSAIILILGISVGLALIMLLAYQSVNSRVASVKSSLGNTITIAPAGAQGFEGGGEPLTEQDTDFLSRTNHISSIGKTLTDRLNPSADTSLQSAIDPGTLGTRQRNFQNRQFQGARGNGQVTGGTFSIPILVTGTDTPTDAQLTNTPITITSGTAFDGSSNDNVALVGSDLATKNNLSIGSTFQMFGTNITVAGIYNTSGNKFANSNIIMPLAAAQRLFNETGEVSSVLVNVDSITNEDAVLSIIKTTLGDKADVTSVQDSSSQALAPLENIRNISLYSLVGALIAGSVIVLLTLVMIVRERRREIGILKAIGATDVSIVAQFISESLVLTLLGSLVGIILGVLFSNPVLKALDNNAATPAQVGTAGQGARQFFQTLPVNGTNIRNLTAVIDWHIIIYGLVAALLIAVIGSALPATIIAKVQPSEAMRGE